MLLSCLLKVLILSQWALLGSTSDLRSSPSCFDACQLALKRVHFNDTVGKTKSFIDACQSRLKSTSLFLCIHEYCQPGSQLAQVIQYNETCRDRAQKSLPPFNIIADFTEDEIAQFRRIGLGDESPEQPFDEVLIPSQPMFQLAFDTVDIASWESVVHHRYGFAVFYFWVIVIGIGLSSKLWSVVRHVRHQHWLPLMSDEDGGINPKANSTGLLRRPSMWIKKYVTLPATFGYKCSQNIKWCTVPSRIQSLTIVAFVVINVVLCTIDYRVFEGNIYWPKVSTQYLRYVSDRTGIISWANFPLIWLFGIRNNVLLWLTGWGFGTYNSFHRWIARVATVEAIVHSIGYTVMVLERKYAAIKQDVTELLEGKNGWATFSKYWTQRWWWAGELATIFMVAISCFSVYGLRRSYYEVFLQAHVWFSAIVLLTMFWHVEIFRGEYNAPAWACMAVWILDRLLRLYRVLSFNPRFWKNRATINYDSDSNMIRMTTPTPFGKPPPPGIYYYLYVLNDLRFWENHPFTLASMNSEAGPTVPSSYSLERLPSPNMTTSQDPNDTGVEGSSSHGSDESELLLPSSNKPSTFTFLIRPCDGFTARLRDGALLRPARPIVLLEGPYGDTHPFHEFDTVLFIVGGSGIATPLSYLSTLLSSDKTCRTSSVRIVWAVREHSFLADTVKTDLVTYLDNDKLSLAAYVTQHPETIGQTNEDPATSLLTGPWPYKDLHVFSGRPAIHHEVQEAAKYVRGHGGYRLAVVACGPGQMADDTRKAVTDVLEPGCENIDYFEESFKW